MSDAAVRITVVCDECVRIEHAPHGRFCDLPSLFAINGPGGDLPLDDPRRGVHTTLVAPGSRPIRISTPRLELVYTPDGRPPHPGNLHALIEHPAPPPGVPTRDGRVLWTPGARNAHNLGGTLSTLDGLLGPHPIGEGLLARDGWHLVDDSTRHVFTDGWIQTRQAAGLDGNTDWYLFAYGLDYPAALRALATIAGKVPLPRKYALGSWYSRYWPYTADEYRGIVDEYDVHGFPLDVVVLDMDWHKPGWTGWSWNRELIPDPESLLHWLHSRGLAVTLNLHPADGVAPHEDRYPHFMRALGREPDGSTVPFDAGDPAYMRALFDEVLRPLEAPGGDKSRGVDFWWVDWQQDRFVRSIPGLSNLRWLNHLFFEHTSRSAGELTPRDPGRRGLSFSRWAGDEPPEGAPPMGEGHWAGPLAGGWGDHRYPIHFSGDAHTGWDMLAFQVAFTVAAGNVGCFYWSHDIGGHFGPRLEEATARWVQFGALSACLRLHSARTEDLDRRPWTYEKKFCDAMRRAMLLRSRLMPSIYTAAILAHEQTLPLLRPMYLACPDEERAYRCPSQYMLGDTLLCAPITSPGLGERCVAHRPVWFPPHRARVDFDDSPRAPIGAIGWFDLASGVRFEPGTEAVVAADIGSTPVFVPAGCPVALRPPTLRMGGAPVDRLVVHAFPAPAGERPAGTFGSVLRDDDGLAPGPQTDGLVLLAHWSEPPTTSAPSGVAGGSVVAEFFGRGPLPPGHGTLPVPIEIRIGGVSAVTNVRVDDEPAPVELVPDAGGTAVIRVPAKPTREQFYVKALVTCADAPTLHLTDRARLLSAALGQPVDPSDLLPTLLSACRGVSPDHAAKLLAIGAGIGLHATDGEVRVIDTFGWIDAHRLHARVLERLGPRETTLAEHDLPLEITGGRARAASVPVPPGPLAEPPPGLKASHSMHASFTLRGERFDLPLTVRSRLRPLSRFAVAGPFAWDWTKHIRDVAAEPETRPLDPAAAYLGRDGQLVRWTPATPGAKWPLDARRTLGTTGALACAWTVLDSPRRQGARFHFEAGDKLQAFLNGRPLHTLDHFDPHAPALPEAHAVLDEGPNPLLVKFSDGGGGWGFRVTVDGEAQLVERSPI